MYVRVERIPGSRSCFVRNCSRVIFSPEASNGPFFVSRWARYMSKLFGCMNWVSYPYRGEKTQAVHLHVAPHRFFREKIEVPWNIFPKQQSRSQASEVRDDKHEKSFCSEDGRRLGYVRHGIVNVFQHRPHGHCIIFAVRYISFMERYPVDGEVSGHADMGTDLQPFNQPTFLFHEPREAPVSTAHIEEERLLPPHPLKISCLPGISGNVKIVVCLISLIK